jgi:hypothetical protein
MALHCDADMVRSIVGARQAVAVVDAIDERRRSLAPVVVRREQIWLLAGLAGL